MTTNLHPWPVLGLSQDGRKHLQLYKVIVRIALTYMHQGVHFVLHQNCVVFAVVVKVIFSAVVDQA